MTNGSHPPKKPSSPNKKEKGLKPRRAKPSAKGRDRLAVLLAGNA